MFNIITKEFKYYNDIIKLETGLIARKSASSVVISINNNTKLLITISENIKKNNKENFLQLTVNYYERAYSYGIFPNNLFKREIRQNENEILISRLIDRSIRPSIDNNYNNEIQITIILLSNDNNINLDVMSIIGVSSALNILNIPYNPIGCSRISIINDKYIINPNIDIYKKSNLNLVISSNKESIIMLESFSNELNENIIINAIEYGYINNINLINNINDFSNKIKIKNNNINNNIKNEDNNLLDLIYNIEFENINNIYLIKNKELRKIEINNIKENLYNKIINLNFDYSKENILYNFNKIEKKIYRKNIIKNNLRLDNRKYDDIRKIDIKLNILPKTHGSSLFTRGDTQSLSVITLGFDKYSQDEDKIIFHYNFLNYCSNEFGILNFPKRREIGHGRLAKKSILPLINIKDFPYFIRIVSEITESDGSSSMASVCSASLSLMHSGVPIKENIAGIAMGLIFIDDYNYIILTDISGEEDNFGDMDIKISRSINGITAIQMDIKTKNIININIIKKILYKSKESILKILDIMNKNINKPNKISNNAPIYHSFNIDKIKIKELIGKGGITIKKIIEETKSIIDIDDNGKVKIYSINNEFLKLTIKKIKNILFFSKKKY